jgi:TPR repeat protein
MTNLVYGDGRAHDPRVTHSFPPDVFVVAGREVALRNVLSPKKVDGVAVPCMFKFKIMFSVRAAGQSDTLKKQIGAMHEKAKQGDPMAQLAYAVVIENRWDLAEEGELPIWWYLKAAQAGIPAAQHIVGAYALAGTYVSKDEAKGLLWLNKAGSAGNPDAQHELANYYLQKSPDAAALASAVDWFGKAVAGGSRNAQFYFAALLATGPDATLRDPARALDLIEKAKPDFGMNPIWFEIRAAAYAGTGDFQKAQEDQTAAVSKAKRLGWNTAPQSARLAEYKAGKSWSGDLFAFY